MNYTIEREGIEYHLIPIEGNEHYYVSRCGKLWSLKRDKRLSDKRLNSAGYKSDILYLKENKALQITRHRLVAITFIPNPQKIPHVDHIDQDKLNNRENNLRWVSNEINSRNKSMRENNNSGVTGVNYFNDGGRRCYWRSSWSDLTGNRRDKYFSVNKYGNDEAFRLACEHRQKMIEEMNKQGAGYSDNHGNE